MAERKERLDAEQFRFQEEQRKLQQQQREYEEQRKHADEETRQRLDQHHSHLREQQQRMETEKKRQEEETARMTEWFQRTQLEHSEERRKIEEERRKLEEMKREFEAEKRQKEEEGGRQADADIQLELKSAPRLDGHPFTLMVQMQVYNGQWVCADNNPAALFANRKSPGGWETFRMDRKGSNKVSLETAFKKFVCNDNGNRYVHDRTAVGGWEMLTLTYVSHGWHSFQGANDSKFLTVNSTSGKLSSENTAPDHANSVRLYIYGLRMTTHFRHKNKFLCVEEKGVFVNRNLRDRGTEFTLDGKEGEYTIKTHHGKFLSIEGGKLNVKDTAGSTETFRILFLPGGIALMNGGRALTVREDTSVGILGDDNIGDREFFTYDGIYPSKAEWA